MIEVKIGGLVPDNKSPGSHVLLLKIPNSQKLLPIWIGPAEAGSILMVLRHQTFERPLTHDLLQHVIEGLGAEVTRVVITSIQNNTYFARIFLQRGDEILSVDARPSDSVALAVRVRCPIFVTEELLESQADQLVEIREAGPEVTAKPADSPPPSADQPGPSAESLEELMRKVERGEGYPGQSDEEEEGEA